MYSQVKAYIAELKADKEKIESVFNKDAAEGFTLALNLLLDQLMHDELEDIKKHATPYFYEAEPS